MLIHTVGIFNRAIMAPGVKYLNSNKCAGRRVRHAAMA